jgi:hypothetical protein
MIAVIFEVTPAAGKRNAYLGIAAELRALLVSTLCCPSPNLSREVQGEGSPALRPALLSPFTGRACRQAGEGQSRHGGVVS